MRKIQIITDSAIDLDKDIVERIGIKIVPFSVTEADSEKTVDPDSIVADMIEHPGKKFKTACPSPADFSKAFAAAYKDKKDVICITVGSSFSGSFNSALIGKSMFLEEYPKGKVEIIDSGLISGPFGLFIMEIARMRDDGLSKVEMLNKIELLKKETETYFTIATLDYLKYGGRIGGMKFVVANTLNFKPIIALKDGKLQSCGVVMGTKKSMFKVVENCKKYMENRNLSDYRVCIIGTDSGKMDEEFREIINKEFILNKDDIVDIKVGGVIACHTGPHTVSLGFMKKYDKI